MTSLPSPPSYIKPKGRGSYKSFPNPFDPLTPSSAWVLGFWFADGCITTNRQAKLTQKHKNPLVKVKRILATGEYLDRVKIRPYTGKAQAWELHLSSVDFVRYLLEFGITKKKSTTIEWPNNLPEPFVPHFMRGVFDGDGYIGYQSDGTTKRVVLASGSKPFMRSLEKHIMDAVGARVYTAKQTDASCWTLTLYSETVLSFCNWIYCGSTNENRLERKYEVYQGMLAARCAGA